MEEKQIVMTAEQIKGWERGIERVAREVFHKSAKAREDTLRIFESVYSRVAQLEEKVDQIETICEADSEDKELYHSVKSLQWRAERAEAEAEVEKLKIAYLDEHRETRAAKARCKTLENKNRQLLLETRAAKVELEVGEGENG
jgi:hypothetical protein